MKIIDNIIDGLLKLSEAFDKVMIPSDPEDQEIVRKGIMNELSNKSSKSSTTPSAPKPPFE